MNISILKNGKKCEKFNEINNITGKEIITNYNISNVCNECKGTYVIPDLIHFVAEWCNIEYAFKVNIITKKIKNTEKPINEDEDNKILTQMEEKIQ